MDLFTITIDNKEYTYIDSIVLNDRKYVAFMDMENVYVSRYEGTEPLIFNNITDVEYQKVIEVLEL